MMTKDEKMALMAMVLRNELNDLRLAIKEMRMASKNVWTALNARNHVWMSLQHEII